MFKKSKEDLRKDLLPESYYVTQESGTERPFTGQYWDHIEDGVYACICFRFKFVALVYLKKLLVPVMAIQTMNLTYT